MSPGAADAERTRHLLAVTAGFSALYAAAVLLGRATQIPDSALALAWPAAGVAVVWFLMLHDPLARACGVLGIVLVTGVVNQATGLEPVGAWLFGLVNAGNGLVAAWVIRRIDPSGHWPGPVNAMDRVWALAWGAFAGAVTSAVLGGLVAALRFGSDVEDGIFLIWFRNLLSGFVVASLLMAVPAVREARRRSWTTYGVVVGSTLLLTYLVMEVPWPITYAMIPPLVVVALRSGPAITSVTVGLQGVIVVVMTATGMGPFESVESQQVRVLVAQGLIVVLVIVGLAIAITDRARAEAFEAAQRDRDRLRNHMEAALVAAAQLVTEPPGGAGAARVVEVNAALVTLTGCERDELDGTDPTEWFTGRDAAALRSGIELLSADGDERGWRSLLRLSPAYGGGWVDAALSLVRHDAPSPGEARELHLQMVDVTAQKQAEYKLAHAALHDDLTGLGNRALWSDVVEETLEDPERGEGAVAVLYIDVDRFKQINDTYGHPVGDDVLRAVGHRIRDTVLPGDTAVRLGGDEFAVLCPGLADEQEAVGLAERLLAAIAPAVQVGERRIDVSVSIGVGFAGEGSGDRRRLLRRADTALYAAKDHGRARFEVYSPDLHRDVEHAALLLGELETGHRSDEMVLHYQPIVDAVSHGVVGLEALLRWQHPVRGLLTPGDFLDVLESSDLIHAVGSELLERACRDAARLAARGMALPVHVNVSARELARPGFVQGVRNALDGSGLRPELLVLEITETRLLTVTGSLLRDLVQVRDLGVQLAVDDFGTGYSALTHLVDMPVGIVKLDRSFVAEIATSRSAYSVCSGVRAMAEGLAIRSVAEGVETAEQARILRDLGYDELQGYHFARPAPLEELGLLDDPVG